MKAFDVTIVSKSGTHQRCVHTDDSADSSEAIRIARDELGITGDVVRQEAVCRTDVAEAIASLPADQPVELADGQSKLAGEIQSAASEPENGESKPESVVLSTFPSEHTTGIGSNPEVSSDAANSDTVPTVSDGSQDYTVETDSKPEIVSPEPATAAAPLPVEPEPTPPPAEQPAADPQPEQPAAPAEESKPS